jgi:aryl-phospho-beta-D-glucosidase BglC (GH1 family)
MKELVVYSQAKNILKEGDLFMNFKRQRFLRWISLMMAVMMLFSMIPAFPESVKAAANPAFSSIPGPLLKEQKNLTATVDSVDVPKDSNGAAITGRTSLAVNTSSNPYYWELNFSGNGVDWNSPAIDASGYDVLDFWIQGGGAAGLKVRVWDDSWTMSNQITINGTTNGTWKHIFINLTDLTGPSLARIGGVQFATGDGTVTSFKVNNIQFSRISSTPGPLLKEQKNVTATVDSVDVPKDSTGAAITGKTSLAVNTSASPWYWELNYSGNGVNWNSPTIDASSYDFLDFWIQGGGAAGLKVKIWDNNWTMSNQITISGTTGGTWKHIFINLSDFTGPNLAKIGGFQFATGDGTVTSFKINNVQFSKVSKSNFTETSSAQIAKNMAPGINIGNTLDVPGFNETGWGNPVIVQQLFQSIKASGFNSVRIPITWSSGDEAKTGPATASEIATRLDRVQQVVDWAKAAGLYVMINVHHDSWTWAHHYQISPTDPTKIRFLNLWTQIATRFKDYDEKLLFELINEPADNFTAATINDLNQSSLDAIRATGSNNALRQVVFTGFGCNSERMINETIIPKAYPNHTVVDPNLIATFHFYSPIIFISTYKGQGLSPLTQADRAEIDMYNNNVYNWSQTNHIPLIMGEYSLLSPMDEAIAWDYYDFVMQQTTKYGFTPILWDAGGHFDRKNYVWKDPITYQILLKSGNLNIGPVKNSLVTPANIYQRTGSTLQDQTFTVTLNGNTLQQIVNKQSATLSSGTDYTFNSATGSLVVKASYLQSRFNSAGLGEYETLTLKFNSGADMQVYFRKFDTPTANAANLKITNFQWDQEIPINFNGTKLAAASAVKLDGTKAKPDNWNSWGTNRINYGDYEVDYTRNVIKLSKKFLDSLTANTIVTLEFWPLGVNMDVEISRNTTTPYVTGIQVDSQSYSLSVGGIHSTQVTLKTSTTATDQNVTSKAFYSSSNPGIATVDSQGNVKAVGTGTATITVNYMSYSKQITVQVN